MRNQGIAVVLFVGMVLGGCAVGVPEQEPQASGHNVKATELCRVESGEVNTYMNFVNTADEGLLNNFCGLDSDAAAQIIKKRPVWGYTCLNEVASVPQVGTGALQQILFCGKQIGMVAPTFYAVFDQATDKKLDNVVSFNETQATETLAFVNEMDWQEIDAIDGFGPALTQAIFDARPIVTLYALRNVPGIGVVSMYALRDAAEGYVPNEEAPPLPPNTGGSYVLDAATASSLVSQAAAAYVSTNAGWLWWDNGYWAYGGEYFTDAFSQSFFLNKIEAYLREDIELIVQDWVGLSFPDAAAVQDAIDDLIDDQIDAELQRYIEYYAEAIGEYTA